jgi:phage terminase large subunit GpA-like protein
MIREGEWKARHPERVKHQGFHINELYSPWSSWTEIAESFVKKKYRVETLRTWINTVAGETFDESGMTTLTGNRLLDARERYTKIPEGVIFLTAAVDVQDDRLECYIEGWGLEEENWLIDHYVAEGSPAKKSTWLLMETFLLEKRWEHENGFTAGYGQIGGLMGVGVDTGGHATKEAYAFVKRHNKKRFFALKGKGGPGIPIVYESKSKKLPVRLTIVGVDDAKQRIYDRLQQEKKGPGYQHFNHRVDKDYFDQLLSEHKVIRTVGGLKVQRWELIDPKRRNEALDCKVYNMAVYHKLNIDVESFSRILRERMEQAGKIKAEFDSQSRTNPQQGIKPTSRRKRLIVRSSLMNKLRRR